MIKGKYGSSFWQSVSILLLRAFSNFSSQYHAIGHWIGYLDGYAVNLFFLGTVAYVAVGTPISSRFAVPQRCTAQGLILTIVISMGSAFFLSMLCICCNQNDDLDESSG